MAVAASLTLFTLGTVEGQAQLRKPTEQYLYSDTLKPVSNTEKETLVQQGSCENGACGHKRCQKEGAEYRVIKRKILFTIGRRALAVKNKFPFVSFTRVLSGMIGYRGRNRLNRKERNKF
ncbi:MAG: hypothetical protein JKY42_11145 [Flavobacteriales bacterium]|nr:hypothetical protein [Flavobacteriales bacterium]